jgi:glycosyltransferase involved in cell wall biosynthesis
MLKLSVVVPCRNEKEYIRECIDAIFHSIYPDNVELSVMVVDGMSNDGTREILDDLKQVYDSLIVIDNTNMLTPYAFNLGIKYKPFDFLQIIGARHIISNNYIATSLSILQQNEQIWCVGGRVVNV